MNIPLSAKRSALFGAVSIALSFGTFFFGHSASAQVAAPVQTDSNAEIALLKKEIELLKGKLPDQSHAMKDVGYHFTNLWFAGQKENWPLAKFYLDETRAHLKWAVRIIPVRKVNGADLELKPLLDGIDQAVFVPLQKSIDLKNPAEFSSKYQQALDGCYSCHATVGKPFLRLHLPEQPEAKIIDFIPVQ